MEKVGLAGVLLLSQAKWCSGCHNYVNLVKEEEKCMRNLLLDPREIAENNISVHCKGMWDDLNCWPPASLGETVSQPCPNHEFFNSQERLDVLRVSIQTFDRRNIRVRRDSSWRQPCRAALLFGDVDDIFPSNLNEEDAVFLKHFKRENKGKVHRNCTASGWTDLLVPHEDACSYTFNETLHFIGESSDSYWYFTFVKTMYTVGYALSLIALTIAIAIFCLFRKLHCTRNYIHIQMFVSFILRAIFIFIRDSLLFTNEEQYLCDYYPVACKVVLMFSNYAILANYSWLLVEAHFLFTLVSRSFFSLRKHLTWYIILSWGLPGIVIIFWGCAKYLYEDKGCWETRTHAWIWWILRVPVLLTISMNVVFFLGILRILVSKLKMSNANPNEFSQYKKLIKSTFFLVALFGLHYILFVFLPVEVNSWVFKIWTFVELALSSTQGFVVAVLYCFINGEVQHELQRHWRRWMLSRDLASRPRRHTSFISHSGCPHTQVSLLPYARGSPATVEPVRDAVHV